MTVGSDVKNGIYAILGARQGCYMTNCTDWDFTNVRNFQYLNTLWKETVEEKTEDDILEEISMYGLKIEKTLLIPCPKILGDTQNQFFKTVYQNPPRMKSRSVIE
jgi:hypothetical protein